MGSRIAVSLISVFVLSSYGVVPTAKPHSDLQAPSRNDAVLSTRAAETCPGIEGNSDFYGLGIRIGIYLQWASAWVNNVCNPERATANHDANTIFLIAVLTAMSVSSANNDLTLAEQYIMLLLSYGFCFTVLTHLGIRLYLLRPRYLAKFWKAQARTCKKRATTRSDTGKRESRAFAFALKPLSSLKHPSLSWAGVLIRAMNGTWLAALSIFTWMNHSKRLSSNNSDLCVQTLFFFGNHDLSHSLLLFFEVMACLVAVPAAYIFLICCGFAYILYRSTNRWAIKYYVINLVDKLVKDGWDSLSGEQKVAIGNIIDQPSPYSMIFAAAAIPAQRIRDIPFPRVPLNFSWPSMLPTVNIQLLSAAERTKQAGNPSIAHYGGDWNINVADLTSPTQVQQGVLSLLAREVEISDEDDKNKDEGKGEEPGTCVRILSFIFNFLILAMIAIFILFIEKTIIVARISGVHTIGTTGQLIPFVIGIASSLLTLRDLVMLRLIKKYPKVGGCYFAFGADMFGIQVSLRTDTEAAQNGNLASLVPAASHSAGSIASLSPSTRNANAAAVSNSPNTID